MNNKNIVEKSPLTIGLWIQGLLEEKEISQRRLAELTGLSVVGVNRIVNGKNKSIRDATVINILRSLFGNDSDRMAREYATFEILKNRL